MPRGGVPGFVTSNHMQAARTRVIACPACAKRQVAAFRWNESLQQGERRCRFCGHVWPDPRQFYQGGRNDHSAPV